MCILILLIMFLGIAMQGQGEASPATFSWTPGPGNPIAYIMERKAGFEGSYREVAYLTGTTWTDEDVPSLEGSPLCWQVRPFNEFGAGDPSNEICLSLPGGPLNFSVTTSGPSPEQSAISIRTRIRKRK